MNRFVGAAVSAALASAAAPAFSQGLEEIVVTATRRAQSLQDVPISVTAVTGELIQDGGFSDMEDLAAFIPNLQMRDAFTGQAIYIRGIGTSTGNEAFEQAVAQFADGVYYGRDNLSQNAFFDLERVEVVRGPQPTFAGQSATAGAINMISRLPGEIWEGNVVGAYGSDEELSLEAGFGGPVSDTFGIRVAARYYELDDAGYFRVVDGKPLGIRENKAARFTGVWTPTDRFDATFKYEYQDTWQEGTPTEYSRCDTNPATSFAHSAVTPGIPALCALDALYNGMDLNALDGGRGSGGTQSVFEAMAALNAQSGAQPGDPDYWGDPASPVSRNLAGVYDYNQDEERWTEADVFSGTLNWQLGDLTFTSQTSLVTYDKKDWLDPDDSSFAIFTDLRLEEFEQTAQELRLTSAEDRTFSWLLGVYWQNHDLETEIDIYMPWLFFGADPAWSDGIAPDYESRSFGGRLFEDSTWKSAFFAGTFNVTDQVRLNFGGRYQDVAKDGLLVPTQALLPVGGDRFDPRFQSGDSLREPSESDDFLPEVGIQWDATDDLMLYVKYAEAFKAGGYVMSPVIAGALPDPFTYLPEQAEGYELGVKGRFADGTLELNIVYFDTDYTDLQETTFLSEEGRFITGNAARAATEGIEFDGRWAASDNFTLGFGGTLLDAYYVEHAVDCNSLDVKLWEDAGNTGQCLRDLTGVQLPQAPDWQLTLTPEYRFTIGRFDARLGASLFWSDGYDLGNDGDPIDLIGSNHRFDVRFGLRPTDANWEIALYGRDITDERLVVGGASDFQQKSNDRLAHNGGGYARERGARWGLQATYFVGN
jgi:iron complex outermembrane recepter protein